MQKPVEVKATSTMTFYFNQQPLKATKGDFYYDILFQSTTTVHYCPTSIFPKFGILNTAFRTIKSVLGYDNYVVGKSLNSTYHKLRSNLIAVANI